ncbi:uncharacterized protein LOC118267866 [Spodoptera frugiperda]|uniref:Uncharacterized protein LOC118267866 n=1 Tax=Spodoptera frugiperda TaxID=7108 RepID=A0A9R0ETD9_SPOFR|nr:uncharacterized protein LOC118267866 [Spodoptera frugiperda]
MSDISNMLIFIILYTTLKVSSADVTSADMEFLNEMPLDKLLRLKASLQDLVTAQYDNVTTTTPTNIQRFGAEAMAIQAPPVKRGDYEEGLYKKEGYSKISNIFSMSVTTLAFLAFGGYLLCLIVQAVKAKQTYNASIPTTQPTTFFVSAGIKKKPQTHFASYGRRRRDNRFRRSLKMVDLPPEQLFTALLQVCEGYAKWSEGEIV